MERSNVTISFSHAHTFGEMEQRSHAALNQTSALSLVPTNLEEMSPQSSYIPEVPPSSKCHDQIYSFPGSSDKFQEQAHMCMPYPHISFVHTNREQDGVIFLPSLSTTKHMKNYFCTLQ